MQPNILIIYASVAVVVVLCIKCVYEAVRHGQYRLLWFAIAYVAPVILVWGILLAIPPVGSRSVSAVLDMSPAIVKATVLSFGNLLEVMLICVGVWAISKRKNPS